MFKFHKIRVKNFLRVLSFYNFALLNEHDEEKQS